MALFPLVPRMRSSRDLTEPSTEPSQARKEALQARRRHLGRGEARRPEPIGIDRLRAIRQAIREGRYPADEDVVGGLARLFRENPPRRDD